MKPNSSLIGRGLPHPFVSVLVAVTWLMLSHSAELFDITMAIVLGLIIPKLLQSFIVRTPNISWKAATCLFWVVLWDIILSNIRVAKQVLGSTQKLQPKWYRVPLDTEHEHVNTLLAMIITTTPGTVTAGIDQERGDILVHALHSEDPEADIQDIKTRYEAPLILIFNAQSGEN